MPAIKNALSFELTSSRFDALVRETILSLGYPLLGLPEPEAKKARAAALEKLQIHRRCAFCGQLSQRTTRRTGGATTASICPDCQTSNERRKRFGSW